MPRNRPMRSPGATLIDPARRDPESGSATPTFVFVHGLASNSFFWMPVLRELALLGHRGLAVDLPGHGLDARLPLSYQAPQDVAAFTAADSPIAGITVADNVAQVIDVVRKVRQHGPVILVGHSLGGVTIGLVATAVPEAIQRLVYVSAFCPEATLAQTLTLINYTMQPEDSAHTVRRYPRRRTDLGTRPAQLRPPHPRQCALPRPRLEDDRRRGPPHSRQSLRRPHPARRSRRYRPPRRGPGVPPRKAGLNPHSR